MNKEYRLNVLSLFDGMSCGQIALERAGFKIKNYFAAEIDKYAIKVTQANYPNTIQLGDVKKVSVKNFPKIDILIGGSPCQGFSFAGKQLNFDDPRSKLFFEYARILKEVKPRYFLLENVRMKKESQDIITKYLGVEPIEINSSLVSAQSRKRLYWTNIPNIQQPEDKGILLKDIIEDEAKGYGSYVDRAKSLTLTASYSKNPQHTDQKRKQMIEVGHAKEIKGRDSLKRVYSVEGKCPTLTAVCGGHQEKKITTDNVTWRKLTLTECERLQTVPEGYTAHVSNTQRYKMLGNGWTVDVIAHIFKNMDFKKDSKNEKFS